MKSYLRVVLGVTSAQTCIVLAGRLAALREAGCKVTLVSAPGSLLTKIADEEGVEAVSIPMRRTISLFRDVLSLVRLYRWLRRVRPDLTDFSTPKAGLLGNLAGVFAGVPRRVYMLRGLKLETATGFKRQLLLQCERLAAAASHVVLANSHSLRKRAIELGIAPPEKILVLGMGSSNGVDTTRFKPGETRLREELGIAPEDVVIGYSGRLTQDKGIPELAIAFECLLHTEPQAYLLLVGWFDAAEDALPVKLRIALEKHPRIKITGYVADTAAYYRVMDIFVLPTHREGFPNAALEAAATALPIVTTKTTGACDAVVDGETGLLVSVRDVDGITAAVLKLLREKEKRVLMGAAGRARVERYFSRERVLGLCVEFYLEQLRMTTLPIESVRPAQTGELL